MHKAIKSIQSVHKVKCKKWMRHETVTICFLVNFLSIFWLDVMFLIGICREQIWKARFLPLYLSWNFWLNCEDLLLSRIFLNWCILSRAYCAMFMEHFLFHWWTFLYQENNWFEWWTKYDISWSEEFDKIETTVSWNIINYFCEEL